jgi:hypothetical protein
MKLTYSIEEQEFLKSSFSKDFPFKKNISFNFLEDQFVVTFKYDLITFAITLSKINNDYFLLHTDFEDPNDEYDDVFDYSCSMQDYKKSTDYIKNSLISFLKGYDNEKLLTLLKMKQKIGGF